MEQHFPNSSKQSPRKDSRWPCGIRVLILEPSMIARKIEHSDWPSWVTWSVLREERWDHEIEGRCVGGWRGYWAPRVREVSYHSLQHNGCELPSVPFKWETLESHLWNGPPSYSREVRANSINRSFPILAVNQNPFGMLPKITKTWTPPQT